MKLERYVEIKGRIRCQTGLRIGGSKEQALEIGALENPIIRHPISGLPYIPGSSLKGKIRSLLEQRHSPQSQRTGEPCGCGECLVCRIFGCSDVRAGKQPTRILFRDCNLTPESEELLKSARDQKGINFSEVKTEVRIDRRTGKAADRTLRTQERVPEGSEFQFLVHLRVFSGDNVDEMRQFIREGIDLLENDYLGGSGSRGYGKVKFMNLTFDGEPF